MSDITYNYHYEERALEERKSEYPIHPLLLSRISMDEMTGEEISDTDLMTLFEAGRWAPSYHNLQPWRFIYAKRDTTHWQKFFDLLWPRNQEWVKNASALVVVISHRYYVYKGRELSIPTHSYDAGAAWLSMALEGTARGFVVHGIGGFDYDKTYDVFGVDRQTHNVDAMIVIGKYPNIKDRKLNENISQRNAIKDFVFEGVLGKNDKIIKS